MKYQKSLQQNSSIKTPLKYLLQFGMMTTAVCFSISAKANLVFYAPAGVSNYSGFDKNTTSSTSASSTASPTTTSTNTYIIYGGMAGDISTCTTQDGVSTCDTCASNPGTSLSGDAKLLACNPKQIYPNLKVAFTFYSNKIAGTPIITDNSTGTSVATTTGSTSGVIAANTVTTLYITWDNLCNLIGNSNTSVGTLTNCSSSNGGFTATFRLGISASGSSLSTTSDEYVVVTVNVQETFGQVSTTSGSANYESLGPSSCTNTADDPLCYFEIESGDGQVKIKNLDGPSSFPTFQTTSFSGIRVYYDTTSFDNIGPASSNQEISITGTTSSLNLSSDQVPNLTNDQKYYFKIAMIDQAHNVGYYTPAAADTPTCRNSYGIINQTVRGSSVANTQTCHIGKPSEVMGLLSQSQNCFIATAAYGSSLDQHVQMFRNFRDLFLVTTNWGRVFVKSYYHYSPPIAHYIAQHPTIKSIVRGLLWPVWSFAYLSVQYGPSNASLLIVIALMIPLLVLQAYRTKKAQIKRDQL